MSQSARVSSIEALQALHAALTRFGPEAQESLGAAEIEIRRTLDHLQAQLEYWRRQVDKRREDVNRARSDLAHRRALRRGDDTGCVEQEIALRKAQARLRAAEDKVAVTRRWLVLVPQAVSEYEGPARRLAGMLDADLRHALAVLSNKIAALEAYAAMDVAAPADAPAPAAAPPQPPSEEEPS
jgi:hypothetical protein